MKIGKIIAAVPAFKNLASQSFSGKTLFLVNRMIKQLETELSAYSAAYNSLVEKYGTGGRVTEDNMEAFGIELTELHNTDAVCEITPIRIPATDDIKLSCNDLKLLEGFIELIDPEE